MSLHPLDPAFAVTDSTIDSGLTKREYFAALAMQGLVNNPETTNVNDIAATAVQYADALISELNK